LFTIDRRRLEAVYPKLNGFRALVAEHDPAGKFRNSFVDKNVL
jgi:xylitol oxidase